jgi:hypothetical protein
MTFTQEELLQKIDDCYNYFQNNKGDTKPNACNAEGIPYHSYETGYHWQIHEASTTSECISLMCRAMVEAGYITYAKQLADYMIEKLTYDDIDTIHWLVNLIDNGAEMESVYCGNYDGAVFTFTNGVAIIPEGNPWYGEKVVPYIDSRYNGIRGVFSTTTGFKYKDYFVEPWENKVEYTINYYETIPGTGTRIVLNNTSFNGQAQVYYGIRNGIILNKDELYRSYPLNTASKAGFDVLATSAHSPLSINTAEDGLVLGDIYKYQISCATDAVQWAAIAFDKLSIALSDEYYHNVGVIYMDLLKENSLVRTADYTIFDATNRGLTYFSVYTYDESGTRNITLLPLGSNWQRMKYEAGSKVVQWGIGSAFSWIDNNLLIKFRGDGSGALRYIAMTDALGTDYYYPFIDNTTAERTLTIKRGWFCNRDGIFFDYARVPYATPYVTHWNLGDSSYQIAPYTEAYKDSQDLYFPYWVHWHCYCSYEISSSKFGTYGGSLIGFYRLGGVDTTSGTLFTVCAAASAETTILYKVHDHNGTVFNGKKAFKFDAAPNEYKFSFDDEYFENGNSIVHPIENFEFYVNSKQLGNVNSTVYFASLRISDKHIAASPLSVLKFETRDTRAGYFDIGSAVLQEGNYDEYGYSGVTVFSNEYYEDGLMNWRSGSYTGYTNPYAYTPGSYDAIYACKFIYDSQVQFWKDFGINGPSYPVYLRNLGENLVYGTLGSWTFVGPDPNTTWAGFQYRAMVNMADHMYFNRQTISANELGYCRGFLNNWTSYLYRWILQNNSLPSTFHTDGTLTADYESPDFYAQVGRAMLLKHLRDWDTKSWYICNWCYEKLILLQQENGSFKAESEDTYNYHQAETILFLAELYTFYDEYKYTTGMTEFTWLPNKVYTAGIEFRTGIFESYSGKEVRTSETKYPIRRWRLKFNKDNTELNEIRTYINSLKGRYSRFNWVWPTSHGGDGNTYMCRLAADDMITNMQHLGYSNFELVFEAIDENAYNDLTSFTEKHNIEYEQQERHMTKIDDKICANTAVNVQWESSRKRWNLQFDKNSVSRKWIEQFFISKKGRFKEWTFNWSSELGGDGENYQVRFDTDSLDFDISYLGFGTFQIPIIEVL